MLAKLSISYLPKLHLTAPYVARVGVSIALLLAGLVGAVSQAVAAELPAVEAVTYDGEKVTPYEFTGDLRHLPLALPAQAPADQPYRPRLRPPVQPKIPPAAAPTEKAAAVSGPLAPMPSPAQNFGGMSRTDTCTGGTCGGGIPPDTNGDVGPNHYIQAVNTAYAIYSKTGALLASFTENQLWAGNGTICNGSSRGDPVVLYDVLADRWILTHLAFASNSGPFYQCIAASKTSDPVAGGWWLYAVRMDPGGAGQPPVGTLNDYGKFGVWNDCLYMGANEFNIAATPEAYLGVAFASFSRSDLYSGAALTWSLGFINNPNDPFTMIPSNLSGQAAASVPAGTPNYFVSESQTAYAFEVRKFTPGPNCGGGGSLSGATNVSQATYFTITGNELVPQPNTTNKLDNIDDRIMQKVQYRKIGATESLWITHNVNTNSLGLTAMQWAQINVTGGVIATTPVQQQIYAPDTLLWRWMGSLAVDNQGNMALGYSTSNSVSPNFPSIAYSGRLASDPSNTLPQTEVQLVAGLGSQTNNCGGAICQRWGDYTAMSVDPADDCTFWYTNQYYSSPANGASGNWQTRVGSFKFPSCVPLGGTTNTLTVAKSGLGSGTVTSNPAGISCGATCSASYASGTSVSLTATPATGSTFAGWSGACSGAGTCTVTMNSAISVTASFASALPDLAVTTLIAPSTGTIGGQITVSATVANQGTASAGAYRLGFYFSTDATITTGDTLIATCGMSALAPGASQTCSGSVVIPSSMSPGTYFFGAFADDLGAVSESNEGNNTASSLMTLASGIQFAPASYTVAESAGSVVLTVSRTGGTAGTISVQYSTCGAGCAAGATATSGTDFVASSGTVTFGPGMSTQTINISVLNDSLVEGNESFTVALSNPSAGGTLGAASTANIIILDGQSAQLGLLGRLYNVPSPGNSDVAFLRIYNTGTLPGPVAGTLYDQSGTVLGTENLALSASLPAKGVLGLSSADLAASFGVTAWSGRAWMELKSSLPAGALLMQNLIRSAALTNMSCVSDNVALNIPAVGNTDQAFVRLYNVGATPGTVRGTLYDQSGNVLGNVNSTLVASLGAKAVSVLSATDIQNATGALTWTGRAWLTLAADFGSNLKIMNLIRDASNTLNNMSCVFN